ncbi:hypothetical protein QF037_001022 [Streptomyces canus]|nr:hypothetical protein [Streptomyces canus]MDQ0596677.1 hypothetical protein [Streptomyces canus]
MSSAVATPLPRQGGRVPSRAIQHSRMPVIAVSASYSWLIRYPATSSPSSARNDMSGRNDDRAPVVP